MSYPSVFLLRHGQTEWNAAGRLQGHLDSKLTETGRSQAMRQAAILRDHQVLKPGVTVYASPLGRAQDTAHLALAESNAVFRTDKRLREITAGQWDGVTLEEIERKNGPLFEQARNSFELMFLAPDGEGEAAVLERCRAFLADLSGPSVLITHGATLCVLRGLLRNMPFDETLDLGHEQGCVYAIENGEETILR